MKPKIDKLFEASSAHITVNDNNLLQKDCPDNPLVVYMVTDNQKSEVFSYLVYIDPLIKPKNLKDAGFSDEFIHLVNITRENKCKFLQLDRDGKEYSELKTFDW